ncbi:MAG: fibronectin type III domain-containing protein [Acidobacteriota bacterium]|nr:fibronectin type III domain-containing protein [Blastocatellia bacterium]MDW8240058.1 fibronectin type III domain-containing protein [Acidobacteriota bacterium]
MMLLTCLVTLVSLQVAPAEASARSVQISNVAVSNITHRIVTITWKTTSESTTQVTYGKSHPYERHAASAGLRTDHTLILTNLEPNTSYLYRIVAVDASGQTALSPTQSFRTAAVPAVPSSLPSDFPSPVDTTTRLPMPGVGGGPGVLYHHPIIFVHGNNESARFWLGESYSLARLFGNFVTPVPIISAGEVQAQNFFERFIAEGYTPAELWAMSYLGRDGVNNFSDFASASIGHSHAANVPDVGAFIEAVLAYTGAEKVDIVAHSLGVTIVREWIRQQLSRGADPLSKLDDLVFIAGANHGAHFCGFPYVRGTEPPSLLQLCQEVGQPDSPFLRALNANETPQSNGKPDYMTIFAAGPSEDFAYPSDGVDSANRPVNLRLSPVLNGALNVGLAFSLPPDPRFPFILPGTPPLNLGDPRTHLLLAVSRQTFDIIFPFVSNLRK